LDDLLRNGNRDIADLPHSNQPITATMKQQKVDVLVTQGQRVLGGKIVALKMIRT
jgi:hypothetical protein